MTKIATWNVNSINTRLPRLLDYLKREQPDILCLQELKCMEEKFPYAALEELGFHAVVFGQKTYNGVAILSRQPFAATRLGLGDQVEEEARLIYGQVNDIHVVSAYIPNGREVGCEHYYYKLKWLQQLRRYCDRYFKPEDKVILAGDFNIAPTELDVWDPLVWKDQIFCTDAERSALASIVEFGFQDTWRSQQDGVKAFSWWDYRQLAFPKNLGLRIDFVLATQPLMKQLVSTGMARDERKGEKPSDHVPVWATFQ